MWLGEVNLNMYKDSEKILKIKVTVNPMGCNQDGKLRTAGTNW